MSRPDRDAPPPSPDEGSSPEDKQRRMAELGQLTAEAVHDVRNPLAAIFALAELLRRPEGAEGREEIADRIRDHARHCRAIVDDLLLFASGDQATRNRLVPGDIRKTIEALHRRRTGGTTPPNVRVEWPALATAPCPIPHDPTALERILGNLIGNAESVLAERGGGQVMVSLEVATDEARLIVEDDGPGIPPEIRDRLFEPFVTRRSGGTGLGLSVSRRLAEAMGFALSYDASGSRGARFVLRMPRTLAAVPAAATESPETAPTSSGPPSEGPLDILIVDDDRNTLETLQRLLSLEGHHVEIANEGQRGLSLFLERDFDLALVDLHIPDLSGFAFYTRLQGHPEKWPPRMVFMTGDCHNPETRSFFERTGVRFIVKPFEFDELTREIEGARDPRWFRN